MNLTLYMSKNYNVENYNKPSFIKIAVIDLDIADNYPDNFVCLLPKRLFVASQVQSIFQKKFGKNSSKILKCLLEQTLTTTDDPDYKKELKSRLKIINPKSKSIIKCYRANIIYPAPITICLLIIPSRPVITA